MKDEPTQSLVWVCSFCFCGIKLRATHMLADNLLLNLIPCCLLGIAWNQT